MKKSSKKGNSAGKKPSTKTIRREKYITVLQGMQEGSQPYQVLNHLINKGHTTSLEIQTLFYITNPTAVISAVRQKGADISKAKIEPRDKNKKPFWRFTLEV